MHRTVTAFLLFLLPLCLLAGDFETAEDFDKNHQYEKAEQFYLKAAEQGHVEAQYTIGFRIYGGNREKSLKWFLKAAEQGHQHAQFRAAEMYYKGDGVQKDLKEAFKWYLKAAEQGSSAAQGQVGKMYHKGEGVSQDDKEAFKWFLKGAKNGYGEAQFNVGLMYYEGQVTPRNYKKAMKWFFDAAYDTGAESDFKGPAKYYLGQMYANGQGVLQDYVRARMWAIRSFDKGDVRGGELRDKLTAMMTPTQIGKSQHWARDYTEDEITPSLESAFVIASSGLNLREAPDAKSPRKITLSAGTRVDVLKKSDKTEIIEGKEAKWLLVRAKEGEGWAFGGFLAFDSPELPGNGSNAVEHIQLGPYQIPQVLQGYKNELYVGHKDLDVINFETMTYRTLVSMDSIRKLFNDGFALKREEWEKQPDKFVNEGKALYFTDSDGTKHPISEEANKSMNEEENSHWARDYRPRETIDSIVCDESANRIFFTNGNAIMAVSGDGGSPQLLAIIPEQCINLPYLTLSPDRKKVACWMRKVSEPADWVYKDVWLLDLTTLQIERRPELPKGWTRSGRLSVPGNLIAKGPTKPRSNVSVQDVYRKNADGSLTKITDFRSLISDDLKSKEFSGGEIDNLLWIVPGKRFIAAIITEWGDYPHGPVFSFDISGKNAPKSFLDLSGFVDFPEISGLSEDYKWWAYVPAGWDGGGDMFLTDMDSINVHFYEKVSSVAWRKPFIEKNRAKNLKGKK